MASRKAGTRGKVAATKQAQRGSSNVFSMFEQAQIQEFKEAFSCIDQNRDGIICKADLRETYSQLAPAARIEGGWPRPFWGTPRVLVCTSCPTPTREGECPRGGAGRHAAGGQGSHQLHRLPHALWGEAQWDRPRGSHPECLPHV
ncbi:myosin regulatory light chain 2, atrial isoform isoform X4 [Theropithecus gelada]|uniref:myosin regulatory light chain 2, atrial isoform isoform X4 n=1 Tax=Theropithecus gelada TaxID=9565 RepID=UPI000DC17966|nr:myosin regulatory light chain 2, atrial isoform isoform X4 [Theropithecus gelada]